MSYPGKIISILFVSKFMFTKTGKRLIFFINFTFENSVTQLVPYRLLNHSAQAVEEFESPTRHGYF